MFKSSYTELIFSCSIQCSSDVLSVFQTNSSSDESDSDRSVSPLHPVRPRHAFPAALSQRDIPQTKEPASSPSSSRESIREPPSASVFVREEYHDAIRSLGSAKTRLQGSSQPPFSSTPAAPASSKSALVPEDQYLADDWLDDDLGEMQPKKKRSRVENNKSQGEETASSFAARSQNKQFGTDTSCRGDDF